jgi:hypothetical protein
MTNSSARTVAYDLRPSKQTERILIADILKLVSNAGVPIQTYPYVGLGVQYSTIFKFFFDI